MEGLRPGAALPAFVPPGIDDQEDENNEPKNQQDHRARFFLPQRLAAFGEMLEVHAELSYTSADGNPSVRVPRAQRLVVDAIQ